MMGVEVVFCSNYSIKSGSCYADACRQANELSGWPFSNLNDEKMSNWSGLSCRQIMKFTVYLGTF